MLRMMGREKNILDTPAEESLGTERRGGRIRDLVSATALAVLTPLFAAAPGARIADDVAYYSNTGENPFSGKNSEYGIPHPRVMRTGIVGEAIMIKHHNEGALGFLTGYVDFARARFFDSRLNECITDEKANQFDGTTIGAVHDRADCLAPIIGVDPETLRNAR
jgi:hypothetical protein